MSPPNDSDAISLQNLQIGLQDRSDLRVLNVLVNVEQKGHRAISQHIVFDVWKIENDFA